MSNNSGIISINVPTDSTYTLAPPKIRGFKYKQQAQDNLSFKVDDNKNITLYYEKLPSKKFKVQLKDEEGYIVETKEETIYENEVFKPRFYDFIIGDSDSLAYKKSIPESDKTWKYSEIKDGQVLLSYSFVLDNEPMIEAQDVYLDYGSTWNHQDHFMVYSYSWHNVKFNDNKSNFTLSVSGDEVKTNTPGVYYVTLSVKSSSNQRKKTIRVIVKKQNGDLPDISNDLTTQLKDEKIRIENTLFYPKKWQYTSEQISKIKNENLFDHVWGLKQKNDFKYEVTSLNTANNKIKFKLKISKDGQNIETEEMEATYKLNNNLIPPNEELKKEIQDKKARIDELILELKKATYTETEINKLNKDNLLDEIKNLITKQHFKYEIVNFSNVGYLSWIEFAIRISKQHLFVNSRDFKIVYTKSNNETTPPSDKLENEKNRINNLSLSLIKTEYSQEEITKITESTLFNNLSNWNPNKSSFDYEIVSLSKITGTISFIIKIKESNRSESIETKRFNLFYTPSISAVEKAILEELKKEKSRIDNLSLKLKKDKYSQKEIDNFDESSLINELSGWSQKSNFKYLVKQLKKETNKITFKIEINKDNKSIITKEFSLNYQLDNQTPYNSRSWKAKRR